MLSGQPFADATARRGMDPSQPTGLSTGLAGDPGLEPPQHQPMKLGEIGALTDELMAAMPELQALEGNETAFDVGPLTLDQKLGLMGVAMTNPDGAIQLMRSIQDSRLRRRTARAQARLKLLNAVVGFKDAESKMALAFFDANMRANRERRETLANEATMQLMQAQTELAHANTALAKKKAAEEPAVPAVNLVLDRLRSRLTPSPPPAAPAGVGFPSPLSAHAEGEPLNRRVAGPTAPATLAEQLGLSIGEKLTIGGEGLSLSLSGPEAPSAGERQALAEGQAALDLLESVRFLASPEAGGNIIGPISGRVARGRARTVGLPAGEGDLYAAVEALRNQVIRNISGAQLSEQEAKRIERQLPDIGLPYATFVARLLATRDNIGFLQQRRAEVLRGSGVQVPTMAAPTAPRRLLELFR